MSNKSRYTKEGLQILYRWRKKAGRAGRMNCPGGAGRGHKAQAEEPYLFNTVPLKISIGPLVKLL